MRYRLAVVARLVATAWCAAACTTWGAPRAEPPTLRPGTALPQARLTLRDGRSVVVHDPQFRGDSVVGQVWRQGFAPFAVARDDVRAVQVRQIDGGRTLIFVGALVGGIVWTIVRGIHGSYTT